MTISGFESRKSIFWLPTHIGTFISQKCLIFIFVRKFSLSKLTTGNLNHIDLFFRLQHIQGLSWKQILLWRQSVVFYNGSNWKTLKSLTSKWSLVNVGHVDVYACPNKRAFVYNFWFIIIIKQSGIGCLIVDLALTIAFLLAQSFVNGKKYIFILYTTSSGVYIKFAEMYVPCKKIWDKPIFCYIDWFGKWF